MKISSLFMVIALSSAHQIKLYNNCPFPVWPGIQGNPGHPHLEGGGFQLNQYEARTIGTSNNWAGRIWARTKCDGGGHCETGDCGNRIQCNGAGGVPPVSLAEMTFTGAGGLDFYDISLVDGYNLPVRMVPTGGFSPSGGGRYDCKAAGCHADLNARCPNELAVKSGGWTVACKSACAAFNTDQYCCRGAHNTPQTCKSEHWPTNYPSIFKSACPDALNNFPVTPTMIKPAPSHADLVHQPTTTSSSAPLLSLVIALSSAHQLKLTNNCPFTVWAGIQGNPGKPHLEGGGFQLNSRASRTIGTANNWAGRVWGRTKCDGRGHCETGDCGNKIQCNGAGGVPPVTLAEMTFSGAGGLDYYDVSLVDGYNLPVRMVPTGGFKQSGGGKYDCKAAGCNADLNAKCPNELAVKSGPATVACKSACAAFNTDEYCCRGAHNTPQTCKSSSWPKNYPAIFKSACPDAFSCSYAYDDEKSTFTCRPNPATNYDIIFCP